MPNSNNSKVLPVSVFDQLARRLRELTSRESRPSGQQVRDEINAICAQAIRCYKGLADAGVPGFDPALVCFALTGDAQQDQACLLTNADNGPRWLDIVRSVSEQFPDRIAVDPGAPEYTVEQRPGVRLPVTSSPGYDWTDQEVRVKSYPLKNWPQRANEYADVLDCLDELAQRHVAAEALPTKPGQKNWLADAMLAVRDNPQLSDAEIARQVGINKAQLSRSREYRIAANLARRPNLSSGHMDKGRLDAVDNDFELNRQASRQSEDEEAQDARLDQEIEARKTKQRNTDRNAKAKKRP